MKVIATLLAAAVLLSSCGSDEPTGPGEAIALYKVSGDGQEGASGFFASEPIVVLVTEGDIGVSGRVVRFTVVEGDARCQQTTVVSDTAGLAATYVLLGSATGSARISASLPTASDTVWFEVSAVAPNPVPIGPAPGPNDPPSGLGDYALRFRGASRHEVRVGLVSSSGDQYTVELWLRPSPAAGPHPLSQPVQVIGQQATDTDAKGSISCTNGTVGFMLTTEDRVPHAVYVREAAPYDEWTHVAGVYDGSAMLLYISGELLAQTPVSGSVTQADIRGRGTILGGLSGTADILDQWFTGDVDEVRIWDVGRTGEQVRANMRRPIAPQAGLIGYWPFNEGLGTRTADLAGYGYSGTLTNFHGNGTPAWIPGVFTEIDTTGS